MSNILERNIFFYTRSMFCFRASDQIDFLSNFSDPKDDIERSYNQYLCQVFFMRKWFYILSNIIAFLFPFVIIFILFRSITSQRKESLECMSDLKGWMAIVPDELRDKYNIEMENWFSGIRLDLYDIKYIFLLICRYPLSPFFIIKNVIKIAKYSYMIYTYSSKIFVVHNEYSFTSSILTEYCHNKGVKHINIMHGEKIINIRDSFFHYDICYIWNDYYRDLFCLMKAESSQFIVAIPPSLKIDCESYINKKYYADYKYYLAFQTEDEMKSIHESMKFSTMNGKVVKYRLHPTYSDARMIERVVGKENVEYPQEVSIESSIANTIVVVGLYTTVLNQAYCCGKQIVLDDVTYNQEYTKLKELGYIMIEKKSLRLSALMYNEI